MRFRPALFVAIVLAHLCQALAVDVRFLAWDHDVARRDLALADGGKEAPIENLHPFQRTAALTTRAVDGKLLVRIRDRTGPGGKAEELPVPISTGITQPLVILLPDAKGSGGLRGFVIDDHPAGFPWGTFRTLNATGKPLVIALGPTRRNLPAGWSPVDLIPPGERPVPVVILASSDLRKPLYSSVWKPDPELRRLVIVTHGDDPRLGALAIKVIPEDRRAVTAAP